MTVATCAAAAAFGIIFATACRSRAQLGGLSTIVILIMSALGGSMVPKFAAPAVFEVTGLFTFNGWALDGYLKVFWHDDPTTSLPQALWSLAPQLAVLIGMTPLGDDVTAEQWDERRSPSGHLAQTTERPKRCLAPFFGEPPSRCDKSRKQPKWCLAPFPPFPTSKVRRL